MKKIIIALIAVLGVAVNVNAQKFGHFDTQSIMQSLPEVTKANGELQATAQQYENDLKTMQEEIQRKADEYDKKKSTMNATDQQAAEQELQTLYNKLQETYQQNQQNIQKKQEELMAPINQKIRLLRTLVRLVTTPISYQQALSLTLALALQMLLQLSRLNLIRLSNEENHINGNMLRLLFHNHGTTSEDWFFLHARPAQY